MENQEKGEGEGIGFSHEKCKFITSFLVSFTYLPPIVTARARLGTQLLLYCIASSCWPRLDALPTLASPF
jgi:hypothetical protein